MRCIGDLGEGTRVERVLLGVEVSRRTATIREVVVAKVSKLLTEVFETWRVPATRVRRWYCEREQPRSAVVKC